MDNLKKLLIRFLFGVARRIPVTIQNDKLLIVRLDGIGDYILFRNSLRFLKGTSDFSDKKFTLLGNSLWKDLAEFFDNDIIEQFIWISPAVLTDDNLWWKRFLLFIKLKLKGYPVIIHPVHSRLLRIDDFLAGLNPREMIGSSGDEINYRPSEKTQGDALYTRLVPVPDNSVFEFYRNTAFAESLASITSENILLEINKFSPVTVDKPYIIITPGAGHASRQWSQESFTALINLITQAYPSLFIYICGSAADNSLAEAMIQNTVPGKVKNFCGKFSLPQFTSLIHSSSLLISNESGPVHLAAATNAAAVCLSNGNMFGRFNPYPPSITNKVKTLYSDSIFYDANFFSVNVENTKRKSEYDINRLSVEQVFQSVDKILKSRIN